MAVRVNQKSWRLKKNFGIIQTNLINLKVLRFFLRKFLGILLLYYSLFLLEFDLFFFNNTLICTIFVFERQRLLKKNRNKTYSPRKRKIKKKSLFFRSKKKRRFTVKPRKGHGRLAKKKKKLQLFSQIKVKVLIKKYRKRIRRKKKKYGKILLKFRKKQLKYFLLKLKIRTFLQKYLNIKIKVRVFSLNTLFLKYTMLYKMTTLLRKNFSREVLQKRYKYFCAKWFYLLPIAFLFNYHFLFALCIKDGLEKTGHKHRHFIYFFKRIMSLLKNYQFGIFGLRIQITGKFNGSERVKRMILLYGKVPSRTMLKKPVRALQQTAYTFTGTFGIKTLFLFNTNDLYIKKLI